jgi:hypothetical protein
VTPAPADPHAGAGKLAQLLGETIVHHAPWTADINEKAKWQHTEKFLEGLEEHAAGQVGPLLQQILGRCDPPPEIRQLIDEAIAPGAQFSAVIEQIFVFGIVSQLLSTSVQPFLQGISNDLWTAAVGDSISVPVSPATIAVAAGRGLNLGAAPTVTVPQWAYDEAAKSGVSPADVDLQASIVGMPPALQELFELQRRGIITEAQVATGLKEGDFRDDWIAYAQQLVHAWLTPLDFVRAAVQDQMSYSDAAEWAGKTGLDTSTALPLNTGGSDASPDMFGLAYSIAGRPPGPEQLARMALRGIIDWNGTGAGSTTFQQGIAESDVKTKWTAALQALSQYVPTAEGIGTLLERGVIDAGQAQAYWKQVGVPDALSSAYSAMAQQQSTIQEKHLARGQIITGYFDGIFTHDQAIDLLGLLGFKGDVADDLLAITDFRREIQAINQVVHRIGTLYEANKISATHAQTALTGVGLSGDQANVLLGVWENLRIAPVRLPTTEEIGLAVKYGTLSQADALKELSDLGYQDRDAQIVLSAHAEQQVTPLADAGTTVTG